ncbi:DUF742 domain-containing protein [Kitasatospora sp. NPDC049285]|uniref:DUF742 domain-containing protein n=1 Tax=Kitasatospora sp. NPDC049285 TaxID=3157096 RepID=UPI00342548A5
MTADQRADDDDPDRFYVVGSGRSPQDSPTGFDLVTLVVARTEPRPAMPPEQVVILRLCGSPLSVAELSAYLRLPAGLVSVLLADLLDDHLIEVRAPVPVAALPDLSLLEAVINGLQRL